MKCTVEGCENEVSDEYWKRDIVHDERTFKVSKAVMSADKQFLCKPCEKRMFYLDSKAEIADYEKEMAG